MPKPDKITPARARKAFEGRGKEVEPDRELAIAAVAAGQFTLQQLNLGPHQKAVVAKRVKALREKTTK